MFEDFQKYAKEFDGDMALFWAGRMSIVAGMLNRCYAKDISKLIELLNECREEYDTIIFARVEEN